MWSPSSTVPTWSALGMWFVTSVWVTMKRKPSQMSKALSLETFYNETQISNKINTWNIWSKAPLMGPDLPVAA